MYGTVSNLQGVLLTAAHDLVCGIDLVMGCCCGAQVLCGDVDVVVVPGSFVYYVIMEVS